ncbi:MAG TPA: [acyl-carrier-protein] S-malonyltransferase [Flavobacteriales bacterium]|jgi:[acyl-carrier-protein] S-malonyltransferase|nr:[acyl-carrier-protein] S-malonyltransferase [Flavobacteriales bacterium]
MKKAYIFPGQGAQFEGMGKDLYDQHELAKQRFEQANEILGFDIADIMFNGSAEDLRQTRVTQPAIFLHSVITAELLGDGFQPDMLAGHSLGEFSALVAGKALSFEDGLRLVSKRAEAMQKATEMVDSTMSAILNLPDETVEEVCKKIDGIVAPANYNCPGQLVISGETEAVKRANEALIEAGARRAVLLPVGGAFHSPLMMPAREELSEAINNTSFKQPIAPVYQNVTAKAETDPEQIKQNLIEQLTAPVRWTQTIQQMIADGATEFVEVGPGKVLLGLLRKIDRNAKGSKAEV